MTMLLLLEDKFHYLKGDLDLPWEDYQHAMIDEFLCMVAGCALRPDVCHWMLGFFVFFLNVNMVQGQQDGPLSKETISKTKQYTRGENRTSTISKPALYCEFPGMTHRTAHNTRSPWSLGLDGV